MASAPRPMIENANPTEKAKPLAADTNALATDTHPMAYREMADVMQMDDTAPFAKIMLDQLEWRAGSAGEARGAWDAQAWYGGDYDRLWFKTEGTNGRNESVRDASFELLWNRVVSPYWNLQAGAREDLGVHASRTWAALGVEGIAPQWIETEASLYAGEEGRTAARVKFQYELLLTQRIVLQPFVEANLYGRADPARQLGSGLSDVQVSLRLRYEIRRNLAPYIGVVWLRRLGSTATLVEAAHGAAGEVQFAAGLRAWL